MSSRKRMIADLLFGVQIIGAFIFCSAYILRSLEDVTGSSIAQFGLTIAFLGFNLALGVSVHRAAPSRVTRQAIATYITWIVLVVGITLAAGTNPDYRWNEKDTTTLVTGIVLTLVVVGVTIQQQLPVGDPMVKGSFAIAYKAVPQFLLAWKFLTEGASGTPGLSVVIGHLTVLIRIGQISFMVREAGWNRPLKWLMASEVLNEVSWIAATIVWLLVI